MQAGDTIYFLSEYNWECGTLVSIGRVNYKIRNRQGHERAVKKEKTAIPDESVAVVWETWKGKNGRGTYRVERELYPQWRVPSSHVGRQSGAGRVTESQHGTGTA